MNTFLQTIAQYLLLSAAAVAAFISPHPAPASAPLPSVTVTPRPLGATNQIETPIALFQTSLANGISAAATSMTLSAAVTGDGTTLASSTYSFIIDEGTASAEFVRADCTGTLCSNMARGISTITGTSSVTALAKLHRRSASVKITDAPLLLNLTNTIAGRSGFPSKIYYTAEPTFSLGTDIPDKTYVDNVATSGAANASEIQKGIVELSTGPEAAAGTASGSTGARLGLPGSLGTSTCQTVQNSVIIASSTTGKLDKGCFDQTAAYTLTGNNTFNATTTISANSTTTKPLVLNSVPYAFPATQGASSSILTNNGTGSLTWTNPVSSFVGTAVSFSTTTSGTNDITYTPNFRAKSITVYYSISGALSATQKYSVGIATFDGTSLIGNMQLSSSASSGSIANSAQTVNASAISVGDPASAQVGLTVTNVSATSFTVRESYTISGNTAAGGFYVVANQ